MVFGAFPPTGNIDAGDTAVQFAHAFAGGHAAPAGLAHGALLPPGPSS